jgi:hypothetical protein
MKSLLAWQWEGYPRFHASRLNLAIHLVTVPLFQAGALLTLLAPITGHPLLSLAGVFAMMIGIGLQGRGHKRERNPAIPFSGPWNFVARIVLEQFINFPRFLLSGGVARAWAANGSERMK